MNDSAPGPLAKLRVIELCTRASGPFSTSFLAEFGAQVIKVELPNMGDAFRTIGTPVAPGLTCNFLNDNRNKLAVTLDVRKPVGRELFLKLVAKSDIVVENFRPGTMEKWQLGHDQLAAVNPKISLVRISAFGQDGPNSQLPGVGRIALGYAGASFLTGEPDGPPLLPATTALGDYVTGLYAALGGIMAWLNAAETGRGQVVDANLFESTFRMLDELAPSYSITGKVRQRAGVRHPYSTPNSHYETGDGYWVVIACSAQSAFERLADAMDMPELKQEYPDPQTRVANIETIDTLVKDWVAQQSRDDLLPLLAKHGVTAGPINSIEELVSDPHVLARQTILDFVDKRFGSIKIPNVIPKLSETPGKVATLGPEMGEHNQAVYEDILGLTPEDLKALKDDEVI